MRDLLTAEMMGKLATHPEPFVHAMEMKWLLH
jgi:hypothetical protein